MSDYDQMATLPVGPVVALDALDAVDTEPETELMEAAAAAPLASASASAAPAASAAPMASAGSPNVDFIVAGDEASVCAAASLAAPLAEPEGPAEHSADHSAEPPVMMVSGPPHSVNALKAYKESIRGLLNMDSHYKAKYNKALAKGPDAVARFFSNYYANNDLYCIEEYECAKDFLESGPPEEKKWRVRLMLHNMKRMEKFDRDHYYYNLDGDGDCPSEDHGRFFSLIMNHFDAVFGTTVW